MPDSANAIIVNPANGQQLFWWISLSRIGFNRSLTQTLALIGDCRCASCYDSASTSMYSTGSYVLIEKEAGTWTMKEEQDAWHIEAPAP